MLETMLEKSESCLSGLGIIEVGSGTGISPVKHKHKLVLEETISGSSLPYFVGSYEVTNDSEPATVCEKIRSAGSKGALLILRREGHPVGEVRIGNCGAVTEENLDELIRRETTSAVPGTLIADGESSRRRTANELQKESVAVVICTRDRPDSLFRCLGSLTEQRDRDFTITLVDNSVTSVGAVEDVARAFADRLTIRLVREEQPGLSNARNSGLLHTSEDIVAWIDDDEEADTTWVESLRASFIAHPEADVVVGRMLPARLQSSADLLFEEFGGHNKGRGTNSSLFSKRKLGRTILYPLPALGAGGNMAFRRSVGERTGGFDPYLGAGSKCAAGEDTLFFAEVLDSGGEMWFEPWVLTWHHHRTTVDELREQLHSYGLGLGGFYAALLINRPSRSFRLMMLLPRAIRDQVKRDSSRNAGHSAELLALRQGNRLDIVRGALTYVRARARLSGLETLQVDHAEESRS